MQTPTNGSQRLGFGLFEADLSARELYKRGVVLHLQDKPFQILTIFLERPGEAVSREELSTSLWPDGTCVDFDEGLNTAIKKLRFALGDSADTPTFIETIPRRGYRFVAPVTTLHIPSAEPPTSGERQQPSDAAPVPSPLPSDVPSRKPWLWLAPVLAGVLASSALVGWIWAHLRTASPREPIQRQLTTNSSENLIESAILSPDGKYLLFGDRIGLHARLIATGETHTFKRPADLAGVLVSERVVSRRRALRRGQREINGTRRPAHELACNYPRRRHDFASRRRGCAGGFAGRFVDRFYDRRP